ncbi:MAG: hypothetical protein H0W86_10675 [Armatimonadetes bacterium]|nr:hypothetical protein [Armatimonadota bacterium]
MQRMLSRTGVKEIVSWGITEVAFYLVLSPADKPFLRGFNIVRRGHEITLEEEQPFH